MNRFARRGTVAVIAVTVLLAGEVGVRSISEELPRPSTWSNPFADTKLEQIRELPSGGTIFVGSSIVNAGLSPRIVAEASGAALHRPVYNAALPQSGIEQWDLWYPQIVLPEMRPRAAVIGVSIRDWNASYHRQDLLEEFRASTGFQRAVGRARLLDRLDAAVSRVSALVRYRDVLRQPASVYAWKHGADVDGWPRHDVSESGRYRGFDHRSYERKPEWIDYLQRGAFRDFTPGGIKRSDLDDLLGRLRDAGVDITLVRMPALHGVMIEEGLIARHDVVTFEAQLAELAEQHGARMLDASEYDDRVELYSDEYHLNRHGVETVSRWLGERLGGHGDGRQRSASVQDFDTPTSG